MLRGVETRSAQQRVETHSTGTFVCVTAPVLRGVGLSSRSSLVMQCSYRTPPLSGCCRSAPVRHLDYTGTPAHSHWAVVARALTEARTQSLREQFATLALEAAVRLASSEDDGDWVELVEVLNMLLFHGAARDTVLMSEDRRELLVGTCGQLFKNLDKMCLRAADCLSSQDDPDAKVRALSVQMLPVLRMWHLFSWSWKLVLGWPEFLLSWQQGFVAFSWAWSLSLLTAHGVLSAGRRQASGNENPILLQVVRHHLASSEPPCGHCSIGVFLEGIPFGFRAGKSQHFMKNLVAVETWNSCSRCTAGCSRG